MSVADSCAQKASLPELWLQRLFNIGNDALILTFVITTASTGFGWKRYLNVPLGSLFSLEGQFKVNIMLVKVPEEQF